MPWLARPQAPALPRRRLLACCWSSGASRRHSGLRRGGRARTPSTPALRLGRRGCGRGRRCGGRRLSPRPAPGHALLRPGAVHDGSLGAVRRERGCRTPPAGPADYAADRKRRLPAAGKGSRLQPPWSVLFSCLVARPRARAHRAQRHGKRRLLKRRKWRRRHLPRAICFEAPRLWWTPANEGMAHRAHASWRPDASRRVALMVHGMWTSYAPASGWWRSHKHSGPSLKSRWTQSSGLAMSTGHSEGSVRGRSLPAMGTLGGQQGNNFIAQQADTRETAGIDRTQHRGGLVEGTYVCRQHPSVPPNAYVGRQRKTSDRNCSNAIVAQPFCPRVTCQHGALRAVSTLVARGTPSVQGRGARPYPLRVVLLERVGEVGQEDADLDEVVEGHGARACAKRRCPSHACRHGETAARGPAEPRCLSTKARTGAVVFEDDQVHELRRQRVAELAERLPSSPASIERDRSARPPRSSASNAEPQ